MFMAVPLQAIEWNAHAPAENPQGREGQTWSFSTRAHGLCGPMRALLQGPAAPSLRRSALAYLSSGMPFARDCSTAVREASSSAWNLDMWLLLFCSPALPAIVESLRSMACRYI